MYEENEEINLVLNNIADSIAKDTGVICEVIKDHMEEDYIASKNRFAWIVRLVLGESLTNCDTIKKVIHTRDNRQRRKTMKITINAKRYDTDLCECLGSIQHHDYNNTYTGRTSLELASDGTLLVEVNSNGKDRLLRDSVVLFSDSEITIDDFELNNKEEERCVEFGLIELVGIEKDEKQKRIKTENAPVYLHLLQGRKDIYKSIEDWVGEGPTFKCNFVRCIYKGMLQIGPNSTDCLFVTHNMIYYDGVNYGYWFIDNISPENSESEIEFDKLKAES